MDVGGTRVADPFATDQWTHRSASLPKPITGYHPSSHRLPLTAGPPAPIGRNAQPTGLLAEQLGDRDGLASQLLNDNEDRVVAHAHARYACACPLAGGYRRYCPGNQIKYRCARVRMLKWKAKRSLLRCDRFPRIMVTEPHRCHRSAPIIWSLKHIILKISSIEIGIRLGNSHNWPYRF